VPSTLASLFASCSFISQLHSWMISNVSCLITNCSFSAAVPFSAQADNPRTPPPSHITPYPDAHLQQQIDITPTATD
jgi:hypothetical protein